jgi:hypothetical protein
MVTIAVLVHDLGHDFMAKKHGFMCEYKLWGIKRFGWGPTAQYPRDVKFLGKKFRMEGFPIGILISLGFTLASLGKIPFAAVSSYNLVIEKTKRLGKKYIGVTDFEDAKIALAGPMATVILLIIVKAFNTSGMLDQFMLITAVMAGFDILPLPGLDGFKVAFGSKQLFVFGALFIYMMIFLSFVLSTIPAILLALAFSLIILVLYVYFLVYR